MELEVLEMEFSVCQTSDFSTVALDRPFVFTARTDDELSIVCPTCDVPSSTLNREDGWNAMRIRGVLDFSLIGILADISNRLASAGISIFALSTYNTDYVLVKKENLQRAIQALQDKYPFIYSSTSQPSN